MNTQKIMLNESQKVNYCFTHLCKMSRIGKSTDKQEINGCLRLWGLGKMGSDFSWTWVTEMS